MRRLTLVSLALSAMALGGCSTLGMDDAKPAPSATAAAAAPSTMAPDVETNLQQMRLMRANGDLVGATRIISQLMLVYPDDARVVGEYGKLLVQENRYADATQFLRRAIELQPNEWTYYSAIGVAFDQQGNHADAKTAYERALALKPGEPAVLNNFAMSRMIAGDLTGARALLLQAKANGATDPKIDANLALLDKAAPFTPAPAPAMAAATPPRKPVVVQAPSPAHNAPVALARGGVMMQAVPVDPLAGPVAHKGRPAKVAKAAPHKPAKVAKVAAAPVAPKPVPAKKTKPADHIPALRMTADAGKP
jgi:Flp pilus assembly protein TadD